MIVFISGSGAAQPAGQVFTPLNKYTNPVWAQKANKKTRLLLTVFILLLPENSNASDFKFITTSEASVWRDGFLGKSNQNGRKPKIPLCFRQGPVSSLQAPDELFLTPKADTYSQLWTRMARAAISFLAKELKAMSDPQIAGGAIIFIYSKKPVNDPSFDQDAEALALFHAEGTAYQVFRASNDYPDPLFTK